MSSAQYYKYIDDSECLLLSLMELLEWDAFGWNLFPFFFIADTTIFMETWFKSHKLAR